MPDAPEVVIVGADGTEHVFPPGFNPRRAAAIVRGLGSPEAAQQAMQTDPAFQRGMLDPFAGAGKGLANTAIGMGQWASRVIPGVRQASEAINGQPVTDDTFTSARETFATPTNEAQKLGFGMEQTGEFFALPAASKGGMALRAVQQGVANGALSAAQGGDARAVALSALPGAAGPFAGRVGGAAVAGARDVAPANVTRMERALNATTRENKVRSARVAPEMVRRGVWSRDLPTLEAMAAHESERAGADVGAAVDAIADKTTDVLPLVESLERAKAPYLDTSAGRRIVIDEAPVASIQKLQDTLMEYGDQISMSSLNKVRQAWDETVKAGKGFTVADLGTHWKTWAAREGRSVLRDELGKASPDIDRVMAEYAFWQNIEDVAAATNARRVGQNRSLLPTIAAGAGAVVSEALAPGTGVAKAGAAVLGGKLAASLKRLVDSPGYQMWSAVQKQRLADALASGNTERIASAIGRGVAAVSTQTLRPVPSH